jgi:hypothetical protein
METAMNDMMLKLLEAQKTLLLHPGVSAENTRLIEQLRATVPAPVLAHFLRLVAQGRRGVAVVDHGVCTECHLRLPASLAAVIGDSTDLHVCEQCGSFLVATKSTTAAPAPVAGRGRRFHRRLAA